MLNKGSARQVQGHDSKLLTVTANVSLTEKRELGYSYSGDIQGEEIVVDSEHAEIILRLRSSLGASFASNPITWLAYDKPGQVLIRKPACFTVTRDSDLRVTIHDWNNATNHGYYRFIINIIYKGKKHVLDPTIFNKELPPPPPPPLPPPKRRSLRVA